MSLGCTLVFCEGNGIYLSLPPTLLWWWNKCTFIEVCLHFKVLHIQKELHRSTDPYSSIWILSSNQKGNYNIFFPFSSSITLSSFLSHETLILNLTKYYLSSKAQKSHLYDGSFPQIIPFTFISVFSELQVHL